ncbi:TPA: hypothetical protein DEP90_00410 [Patescibacteria group bacterium]|nr:hypothetical protein [Patescibacteria group bacterium]
MRLLKFLKAIVLTISFFSILILGSYVFKNNVLGYSCTTLGLYCQAPDGSYIQDVWLDFGFWFEGEFVTQCIFRGARLEYICTGDDSDCNGGLEYYLTYEACDAQTDLLVAGCCGSTDPTPDPGCTPGCGSCSAGTYSTSPPVGYGTSGTCTYTKADCTTETRNCYSPCNIGDCTDYGYLDSCPEGETCRELPADSLLVTDPIYPGCPTEYETTCYSINAPSSELDLIIIPGNYDSVLTSYAKKDPSPLFSKIIKNISAQEPDSILGFTSTTHSGINLNNPIKIWAEFSDIDGTEDIMAIYVWWSDDGVFTTPNRIADPTEGLPVKVESEDNWGIMVRRIDGNWSKVYAPHISATNTAWVEIGGIGSELNPILAEDGVSPIVEIYTLEVTDIPADSRVELEFLMNFLDDSSSVTEGEYFLWSLANDVDGFLPFEEYEEVEDIIIDYDHWEDSTKDWNIDLTQPVILNNEVITEVNEEIISVSFNVSDNLGLSYVRLDACRTGGVSTDDLTSSLNGTPYILSTCASQKLFSNINNITSGTDLLGSKGSILGASSYSSAGLTIDLNGNEGGAITFWITAMDLAGNYTQTPIIYELGEWVMTTNGLVYGTNGVSSTTRNIEDGVWDPLSKLSNYGFEELYADLTDEVLLGGSNTAVNLLEKLVKYNENKSFKASNFPGVYINSPYTELLIAYNVKKENPSLNYGETTVTTISGHLTDLFSETHDYYIINNNEDEDTKIDSFVCDGKGLIIVNGNVTITPDITNSTTLDACIILASGDITIQPGSDKEDSGAFGYDLLHSFLIANGEIVIEEDLNNDGLLVEGGLVAFTPNLSSSSAIVNNREIGLVSRNIYPVLVVNNNAKYGLLSRTLFGSQIDVFKIEVGFKPF